MSTLTDEQRARIAHNRAMALQRKSMSAQSQPISQEQRPAVPCTPQGNRSAPLSASYEHRVPPPHALGGQATRGIQQMSYHEQSPVSQQSVDAWSQYEQHHPAARLSQQQQQQVQQETQTQDYYSQQANRDSYQPQQQQHDFYQQQRANRDSYQHQQAQYAPQTNTVPRVSYEQATQAAPRPRVSDSTDFAVLVSASPDNLTNNSKRKSSVYNEVEGHSPEGNSFVKASRSMEGEEVADHGAAEAWYHCGNKYKMNRARCKKCHLPQAQCINGEGSPTTPIVLEDRPLSAPQALPLHQRVVRPHAPSSSTTTEFGALLSGNNSKKFTAPIPTLQSSKPASQPANKGAIAGFFAPKGRQRGHASSNASSTMTITAPTNTSSSSSSQSRVLPWKSKTPKPSLATPPSEVQLSSEQQQVLQIALGGESIFFTGNAGTGKSTLLRTMIKALRYQHGDAAVAVTASTGAASTILGGTTIHSFSGCGIAVEEADFLAKKVSKNRNTVKRWQQTKVLIIDEVSMLDGDLFDKLDAIGSACCKRKHAPTSSSAFFGGVQLILCGDFFQLPPVTKSGAPLRFCFEARAWSSVITRAIVLRQVFRQKNPEFVETLNELRSATLTPASIQRLKAAQHHKLADSQPTRLCAHNSTAETQNAQCLSKLQGPAVPYAAYDSGEQYFVDQLAKNSSAPTNLLLKLGAKVILLKNLDVEAGLVNGSRGTVIAFVDAAKSDDDDNDDQGGGGGNEGGGPATSSEKLPMIEFLNANDGTLITKQIGREDFTIEQGGREVAKRSQLPLKLAWAISIHKSQGMTIDCLEVDLRGCFEFGQAYVALSRATSLQQLRVLNFEPKQVKAHPKVVEFYRSLHAL